MKKKIAIIHPQLTAGGGSEACPLWLAQILKKEYDISFIAMGKVNLPELNQFYGTNIQLGEVKVVSIPLPKLFQKRFDALRSYKLTRFCKKIAPDFDLMISTYNVMDFGKQGIQFVADFSFDDHLRRMFDPEPSKSKAWLYKKSFFRNWYIGFAKLLSGQSSDGWKKNLTIANSQWTQKILQQYCGIESLLIYPPVVGNYLDIPWSQKENGFVYLGRISPEKQIEKIIDIIKQIRKTNTDVSLHIVGGIDDLVYGEYIKNLCAQNNNWCFVEGQMQGQKKRDFLAKYKYGISARFNEPFGIAVAEMVKAGCIVFVPDGGGQVEIISDDTLIYQDANDAVKKIENILNNEYDQLHIVKNIKERTTRFSVGEFEKHINHTVNTFLH